MTKRITIDIADDTTVGDIIEALGRDCYVHMVQIMKGGAIQNRITVTRKRGNVVPLCRPVHPPLPGAPGPEAA